jgi:6-phosphogluconate dehydrogenase (decarboxylating)
MQLGVIGLGLMGENRVVRLIRGSHECVASDAHTAVVQGIVGRGAKGGPALFRRLSSRDAEPFAHKVISAMRPAFGGHAGKQPAKPARTGGAQ